MATYLGFLQVFYVRETQKEKETSERLWIISGLACGNEVAQWQCATAIRGEVRTGGHVSQRCASKLLSPQVSFRREMWIRKVCLFIRIHCTEKHQPLPFAFSACVPPQIKEDEAKSPINVTECLRSPFLRCLLEASKSNGMLSLEQGKIPLIAL